MVFTITSANSDPKAMALNVTQLLKIKLDKNSRLNDVIVVLVGSCGLLINTDNINADIGNTAKIQKHTVAVMASLSRLSAIINVARIH